MHPLDNPIWHALNGPHAGFATRHGPARRYPPDVAFFAAVDDLDADARTALAELAAEQLVVIARAGIGALDGELGEAMRMTGHQYVLADDVSLPVPPAGVDIEPLGVDDVAGMLDLVRATEPGPFLHRTIELGDYYGVRDGDRLVAMAGERCHLEGWCEISAVCTHPDAQRRGLGAALTAVVAAGIRARGETPFLHVVEGNAGARRLYERMGFRRRAGMELVALRPR